MSIFEDTLDHHTMHNELTNTNIYSKVIFAIAAILLNLVSGSPIMPFIIFLLCSFFFQMKHLII